MSVDQEIAIIFVSVCLLITILYKCCAGSSRKSHRPDPDKPSRYNSLLHLYEVRHVNAIVDQFKTLDQVTDAVRRAGLESSNLIFGTVPPLDYHGVVVKRTDCTYLRSTNDFEQCLNNFSIFKRLNKGDVCSLYPPKGVDFTASNEYQGKRTFQRQCLHALFDGVSNPYQQVISILGETLSPFDEDGIIPAFGFGDASTKDKSVFSFKVEGYCRGFQEVLQCYERIASRVILSGPTNFAPLIYQAIDIVKMTRQYHILIIVADGQVTSERATRDAIVAASKWPLSIIMVGVGDGPWDQMAEFDDALPERTFDNFQFVDYNRVLSYGTVVETTFALHALMEIPDQFKAIRRLGLLDF